MYLWECCAKNCTGVKSFASIFGAYNFFCIAQICTKKMQKNMPWELCLFCIAQICEISWGKDRGKMCTSFCLHFWHKILLKNLRKKFWCKKITNRIAQKNKNHPANVCTVFVQILHFTKISPKNCAKKAKKLWILYANMTGNITSFAGNVNFLFPTWIYVPGGLFKVFFWDILWHH